MDSDLPPAIPPLPHEPATFAPDCPQPDDHDLFGLHDTQPWRTVRQMIQDWWNRWRSPTR